MTRYLISFDYGWMTFPEEELPAVGEAAHAVIQQAKDAGVYVLTGGLKEPEEAVVVAAADGSVAEGPYPGKEAHLGGFTVVDVPSRAEALEWAARIAAACRCAQEVREIQFDPEV